MPGVFSKTARPKRPGAYTNFDPTVVQSILPAQGAVVAVPITHSWGPFKVPTLVQSYEEFKAIFGPYSSAGDTAVRQAFQGEGLLGRGGAGGVLVHRFGASAAAKATKTLQNTTPASALKLDARYEGTKGNDLRVTVQDYTADNTKDELIIYDGTVELERYRYTDTDIAGLAADINAKSGWVTASSLITGVKLTYVSAQAFASGNDGTSLVAGDWTAVMTALEAERFGILAPFDLTDGSILTSLVTWAKALNAAGRRFMTVVGGAAGESVSTANTRSSSINDPNFVNVGGGSVTDSIAGTLSTSQLAPRVAGILAARGEAKSITFARMAGLTTLTGGATAAEIETAFTNGTVVLARDTNADAPIRIEKALTTFSTTTDTTRPYKVFSNPKFVRTMHGIESEITEFAESPGVIGELPVNDKTRAYLVGETKALLQGREEREILQPGSTVGIDQNPPPSDDDEFVGLSVGLKFSRTAEQIYYTIRVG